MRRLLLLLLFALVAASPAAAQPPETDLQRWLVQADSPASLRRLLNAKADSALATDPAAAGELAYYVGRSFERGGKPDSAIAAYRRAVERRGGYDETVALADALLGRRGDGDVEEARRVLEAKRASASMTTGQVIMGIDARRAWALQLAGHPDSALSVYRQHETLLTLQTEWRYRIAAAALAAGDPHRAYRLLLPLAAASRREDPDVMARIRESVAQLNAASHLDVEIQRVIQQRDALENQALTGMGAIRGTFPGGDGFLLSGAVIAPKSSGRHRGAVVLVAPGDTVADYDSLSIALVRSGYAVMLMFPRGSGASVGPTCPLPDRWAGREEALETATARDVHTAFLALGRATSIDTTGYLVVAVGAHAPIAVEAASLDRRVRALLLVSPRPDPVDRAAMRARLARLKLPVYYQSGPEDFDWFVVTERLYEAGNRGASRVADARLVGHGVRQFYYDPALTARFMRWLDESLRPPKRPAPPPAPHHSG